MAKQRKNIRQNNLKFFKTKQTIGKENQKTEKFICDKNKEKRKRKKKKADKKKKEKTDETSLI